MKHTVMYITLWKKTVSQSNPTKWKSCENNNSNIPRVGCDQHGDESIRTMKFRQYGITDNFILEAAGQALLMSREEAETLFVMIGHTLQDHDIGKQENEEDTDYNDGAPCSCE